MSDNRNPGDRFEVEIKFANVDAADIERRLREFGSTRIGEQLEVDEYLSHPCRDFRASGEVFRIRRRDESVELTYKGPKLSGPAKTREEIEIGCGTGADALAAVSKLCDRLGFEAVRTVQKRRTSYRTHFAGAPISVTIDEVDSLGTFAEVERLANGTDALSAAQDAVVKFSELLGLRQVEPRSYLRMLLDRDADSAGQP